MKKILFTIIIVMLLASNAFAAINWTTTISNVNISTGRANVTFTRTDSEDVSATWTKTYAETPIGTGPERAALIAQVWAAWQTEKTLRASVATFVANLEQLANAQLETLESEDQ